MIYYEKMWDIHLPDLTNFDSIPINAKMNTKARLNHIIFQFVIEDPN